MTDRSLTPITVTAVRIGRANLGGGNIMLDDDGINVLVRATADERPVRIAVESIDSVAVLGNELTLTLNDGPKVAFAAAGAAQFATAILARCRALPELTRTLRTFGSRRGTRSKHASTA